jgi:hypothetical protein
MKKIALVPVVGLVLVLAVGGVRLSAYNPGAHIYIAQHSLGTLGPNFDYGALAPDIVWYANPASPNYALWLQAHTFDDLSSLARTFFGQRFAKGWMTHNEIWGADSFAHGPNGYVVLKAGQLAQVFLNVPFLQGYDNPLGHSAIEMAIDLLLKRQDPMLGSKVIGAALLRSPDGPELLVQQRLTNDATLTAAESVFRDLLVRYGSALAFPAPLDRQAMAQLASQIAKQAYQADVSPQQAAVILDVALQLCKSDYLPPINHAIASVKSHM